MFIREIEYTDLSGLLELYTYLHNNTMPVINDKIMELWRKIADDPNHHIIVGVSDEQIIASCVLVIVPNLTQNQKSYALIENVITHPNHRNKGYATQILNYAKDLAVAENCYKIMLMTTSNDASTHSFYEKAGYNRNDKTAFIQWLK